MAAPRIEVIGLRELSANTRRLLRATDEDDVDRILYEESEPIAQEAGRLAPKDTTSLEHSYYRVTRQRSDYAQRALEAKGLNPKAVILPEIIVTEPNTLIISSVVAHHFYQELGTSRMAARPHLRPAFDMNIARTERRIADRLADEIKRALR